MTIVGEAGIGKSRLVAEALATLNVHAVQARCPPYGEGITYWPVVEVVEQLGSLPSDPAAAAAIRALLRESDAGTSAEEIAWAFRKLLEQEAPLVVVFDDIHWGEETFLDLLEHLALMSAGMPILVLCMARPELLGKRAEWPVAMRLEPLAAEQVAELIGGRVPEELRERVARVAGGNPLFVVEMLAMAQEGRDLDVPPTLRALLAARLDQLDEPERRVLEHAAVEGEVFHRGAVRALTPDEPQVTHQLAALVRRGLIRRDKARITGEDSFRFCHLLIRDAAYDALPKSIRADLHERFADWLEQRGQALVELDELLGYHLERAVGLLRELGPPDEHARSVAREASERLARCGERARLRGDMYAAENLLVRSTSLLSRDNPARLRQALSLVEVLEEKSRTAEERELLHETLNLARAMGDNKLECRARLLEIYSCAERDLGFDCAAGLREAERLVKELERANERAGLARAWDVVGRLRDIVGRTGAAEDAYSRGCGYARSEGDRFFESWILIDWLFAKVEGPAPISDGVAFSESILERADTMPRVGSYARSFLALLYAQHGRFAEARQLFAQARHLAHQFGHEALLIFQPLNEAYVDLLAADASGAEEKARATIDLLRRADYPEHGAFLRLAQALYEQARFPEARQALELAGEIRSPDAQSFAAKLHAAEGDFAEAERLARRAVAAAAQTDHLLDHADTLLDLAEVLRLVRRPGEAVPHVQQAIRLFEQKEATYRAIKARAVLTNLAA